MRLSKAALLLLTITATPFSVDASGDFICGIYQVQVVDARHLVVDGKPAGNYQATILDKDMNYLHQFRNGSSVAVLRETQRGRIAFMIPVVTRWNACASVLMGFPGSGAANG